MEVEHLELPISLEGEWDYYDPKEDRLTRARWFTGEKRTVTVGTLISSAHAALRQAKQYRAAADAMLEKAGEAIEAAKKGA